MRRAIVESLTAEFRRYKALAEAAMAQLGEDELSKAPSSAANSVATVAWHIAGNLRSRFTDFLTSDGEKPWRDRESEFEARDVNRADLSTHWEDGWQVLLRTLEQLSDDDLDRLVSIRGVAFPVHEALHRALAHVSYHVGQVVYVSRLWRGEGWNFLSIPPGGSEAYNANPAREDASRHAEHLARRTQR